MNLLQTFTDATAGIVAAPLSRGPYFLRGRGRQARGDGTFVEGLTTSMRVFFSTGSAVSSRSTLGLVPDMDCDGSGDLLIGNDFVQDSSTPASLIVKLGSGTSTTGKGLAQNGLLDPAFSDKAIFGGRHRWRWVRGDRHRRGASPDARCFRGDFPQLQNLTMLRYELNASKALVRVQTFGVQLGTGEGFLRLVAAGDVNGDGYADIGVVRSLQQAASTRYPGVFVGTGVAVDFTPGARAVFRPPAPLVSRFPKATAPSRPLRSMFAA